MAKTRVRDPSFAPLRVCPCTPRPRDMVLVVRDVRGLSIEAPGHVQRDTTSDGTLALGHSRSGFTQAPVAQQAEQPPCKRQAARSNRRRGHHQTSRVRLDGPGHHSFKVGTRVRIPHAMPVNRNPVELTLRGGNRPQRLGGAGTRDRMDFSGGVAQHPVEQPPCKRQAAGSVWPA